MVSMAASHQCRVCGSYGPVPSHFGVTDGGGCRTCGGSPLCDACGHPRSKHVAVFKKGRRKCRLRSFDMQSLSSLPCMCAGYRPIEGRFAEAAFAQPTTEPILSIRLAPGATEGPA